MRLPMLVNESLLIRCSPRKLFFISTEREIDNKEIHHSNYVKKAFEQFAADHSVSVKQYHVDNGPFADNAFRQHCFEQMQTFSCCANWKQPADFVKYGGIPTVQDRFSRSDHCVPSIGTNSIPCESNSMIFSQYTHSTNDFGFGNDLQTPCMIQREFILNPVVMWYMPPQEQASAVEDTLEK
ncbi:hypothetical protein ACHAW6_008391 [Cyclotella cf. meneghiniana]